MLDKLKEMQEKMNLIKERLDAISVEGNVENGLIKVVISGNRIVKNISVDTSLLKDSEKLEELLVIAVNRALENAESVYQAEMTQMAGIMMPNLGKLFG